MSQLGVRRDADILRNIGGAGLQRGQDPDHHGDRPLHEDRDVVPGSYAVLDEAASEPVRLPVELAVGDRLAEMLDRGGLRTSRDLRLECMMDGEMRDRCDRPLPEPAEQHAVAV